MNADGGWEAAARRYQSVRRAFAVLGLVETVVVLIALQYAEIAAWFDTALRSRFAHPGIRLALFLAVFQGMFYVLFLPQRFFIAHVWEKRFGMSNEGPRRWIGDDLKAALLGLAATVAWMELFFWIVAHWERMWWPRAAAAWLFATLVLARVFPALIVPIFYPMKPLPESDLKRRLVGALERLGIRVRDIYEIALSRKTRKANAAVLGVGSAKRIVLGDTLLKDFTPGEIESVLAHEIAHFKRGHIPALIFARALQDTAGFWALERWGAGFLAARFGARGVDDLSALPLLALALIVYQAAFGPFQKFLSRCLEYDADRFAVRAAGSADAFESAMRKLAVKNLVPMDARRAVELIFYTHPPMSKRIRNARAALRPSV